MLQKRLRVVLVVLLGGFATVADAQWAAYTSRNFTLYSDARQNEVLELLRDFEEYRRVALAVMSLPDQPENQALKIVYPTREADFRVFGTAVNVAGFFYHREFGPRMVIRGASRRGVANAAAVAADRRTLYHEYVHYLMDQRSGRNYPPWYREGLAQVLMMVDPSESTIRIGMPLNVNWRAVGTTVDDLIDTDYDGNTGGFYAMSWLLTHFLTVDASDKPQRSRQFADYLRRYDAAENPLEAFSASFGESTSAMQRTLEAYRQQRTLKVLQVPRSPYDGEVSRRELQDGEELYLLGDLAVELYSSASALRLFETFANAHRDSPLRFKVLGRRGVALAHEDRIDEGDAVVGELLALNLDDGDIFADIAHYYHDRFQIQSRTALGDARANLEDSIRYGQLAVERNARDLEALFYLGRAYGFSGAHELAVETLLKAFEQAPGVDEINLALARALYQTRNVDDAVLLLTRNLSATHSEQARQRYRDLIRQMQEGNVDEEFLDPYSAPIDTADSVWRPMLGFADPPAAHLHDSAPPPR